MQVSRQAIHDLLKRVEQALEHYESILGFLRRHEETRRLTQEAAEILRSAETKQDFRRLGRVREILGQLDGIA